MVAHPYSVVKERLCRPPFLQNTSVISDLPSQVGHSVSMWAEWPSSAFCDAWSSGPSEIGQRWASSLCLGVGYEHCPYAELWPLTGALRVTEYPQNEHDPCRYGTRLRVLRRPFVWHSCNTPIFDTVDCAYDWDATFSNLKISKTLNHISISMS
ncbi:hypothetical protein PIB30_041036 [Stylosanthes scabra]|uniref:Uncharacterized protein n=1 Tax=Stylosanthes scabra TaxID=79078 RepID=A0ABU6RF97_9FABA|nr:hypothetical protein [Stylosanthes scabra]